MHRTVVLGIFVLFCIAGVQSESWRELSSLFGVAKPFRQGHAAIMTEFGRMASFSGLDNTLTGSRAVSRYNYLSNSQLQILPDVPSNERPSRQLSGFGAYQKRYLVQYGGLVGGQNSKELLIFDVTSGSWLPNITTSLSDPTYNIENHFVFGAESPSAAVGTDGNLWIFGGRSTILQLNFVTKVGLTDPSGNYQFVQVNLTDTANQPARRYASSMTFYNASGVLYLYLFGGRKGLGSNPVQDLGYFGDLSRFDISARKWSLISASGAPSPRGYAASIVLGDGQTWVHFGGINDTVSTTVYNDVHYFNLDAQTWSTVVPTGAAPSPRYKLVAVHLGWPGEDSVLFHGGADATGGSLNAFWKLEIVTNNTSPIAPPPDLDVDAGVTDVAGTSIPPSSSAVVSSSSAPPVVLPEDEAASALTSWLSWV